MSAAIGVACVVDLIAKIKSVASVQNRVHHIFSEEELLSKTKGLSYPCVGVLYDGLKGVPVGADKRGVSATIHVSILLLFRQSTSASEDVEDSAVSTLDQVRAKILCKASPSGQPWQFQVEAATGAKNGVFGYLQRWACPVTLSHK